ncbi:MAG: fibronectin type III-like domain-contianing protein, partial [Terracidiphilus sp.]
GESRHITFTLDPRTLSQVDEKGTRAVSPGNYKLSLGSSQPDGDAAPTVQSATFTITGTKQIPR